MRGWRSLPGCCAGPQLSDEEKRTRYSEFSSHELNIFLWRKDPAFFKAVVQPYLANKKDKSFIDEFLLEADLTRYLEPWSYSRLNIAGACPARPPPPARDGCDRAPSARAF
jgi:hypothetical protein